MSEDLFASLYIDECITPLVSSLLKKAGVNAISPHESGGRGLSDLEQMLKAKEKKCVFVTADKRTFLKNIKGVTHYGIILIPRNVSVSKANVLVGELMRLLNKFTADEFENTVLYLSI